MNNITLKGYHITDAENSYDIIQNGFINKDNPKHFLGQGAYFYSELEIAKINVDNRQINYGCTVHKNIIECCIVVHKKQYLDLDDYNQNNKFRKFWNQIYDEISNGKIQISFNSEKDFTSNQHLYYKCFILDLYKEKNDYKVVAKTFAIENPSYGVRVSGVKYSKLPYLERYLCVSDDACILKKSVVYDKIIEEAVFI